MSTADDDPFLMFGLNSTSTKTQQSFGDPVAIQAPADEKRDENCTVARESKHSASPMMERSAPAGDPFASFQLAIPGLPKPVMRVPSLAPLPTPSLMEPQQQSSMHGVRVDVTGVPTSEQQERLGPDSNLNSLTNPLMAGTDPAAQPGEVLHAHLPPTQEIQSQPVIPSLPKPVMRVPSLVASTASSTESLQRNLMPGGDPDNSGVPMTRPSVVLPSSKEVPALSKPVHPDVAVHKTTTETPPLPPATETNVFDNDPFAVFSAAPSPPVHPPTPAAASHEPWGDIDIGTAVPHAPAVPTDAAAPVDTAPVDIWAEMGFDPPSPAPAPPAPVNTPSAAPSTTVLPATKKASKSAAGLPRGGETYKVKIYSITIGVLFFKPQKLIDSVYLQAPEEVVKGLGERPAVAFVASTSDARAGGVKIGHVLLKVNGQDATSPAEATRMIKRGARPLTLEFYKPPIDNVVIAEGLHMVKYDTIDMSAPLTTPEWKPKYVVVGGIIAKPWLLSMYRSKSEYDTAVIETQSNRPVSVKVKQFSLKNARIKDEFVQVTPYHWYYFVIIPSRGYPIKISSKDPDALKPVHDGVHRVLEGTAKGDYHYQ